MWDLIPNVCERERKRKKKRRQLAWLWWPTCFTMRLGTCYICCRLIHMICRSNNPMHHNLATSWICWEQLLPGGMKIRSSQPELFSLIYIRPKSKISTCNFLSTICTINPTIRFITSIFLRTSSKLPTCSSKMNHTAICAFVQTQITFSLIKNFRVESLEYQLDLYHQARWFLQFHPIILISIRDQFIGWHINFKIQFPPLKGQPVFPFLPEV